jgi:hypothetical protein
MMTQYKECPLIAEHLITALLLFEALKSDDAGDNPRAPTPPAA